MEGISEFRPPQNVVVRGADNPWNSVAPQLAQTIIGGLIMSKIKQKIDESQMVREAQLKAEMQGDTPVQGQAQQPTGIMDKFKGMIGWGSGNATTPPIVGDNQQGPMPSVIPQNDSSQTYKIGDQWYLRRGPRTALVDDGKGNKIPVVQQGWAQLQADKGNTSFDTRKAQAFDALVASGKSKPDALKVIEGAGQKTTMDSLAANWIDKKTSELMVGGGMDEISARTQAAKENPFKDVTEIGLTQKALAGDQYAKASLDEFYSNRAKYQGQAAQERIKNQIAMAGGKFSESFTPAQQDSLFQEHLATGKPSVTFSRGATGDSQRINYEQAYQDWLKDRGSSGIKSKIFKEQFESDAKSLDSITKNLDSVAMFDKNTENAIGLAQTLADDYARGKYPDVNKWSQIFSLHAGDEKVQALKNAIMTASLDYQKLVTAGSQITSAELSVGAQKRAEDLISSYDNSQAFTNSLNVMLKDGMNRVNASQSQREELLGRMENSVRSNVPSSAPPVGQQSKASDIPSQVSTPPVSALKEGVRTVFKSGEEWTLQGGKQVRIK